jgi:flavin-dependent dehydrogenase
LDVDVVIVGAGPAGSTAALNVAPFRRVLLIDSRDEPAPRLGESLPGAAKRLLTDMGLWKDFADDNHSAWHVLRSAWGGPVPLERHTLADPDGHGWHLDRAALEKRLRAAAVTRGARLLAPARLTGLARCNGGWRTSFDFEGRTVTVMCRLLIDASGRASRALARIGVRRVIVDRLVCASIWARDVRLPQGVSHIEAESDGWWYAAPLPGGGAVLAFHTDADLPAARAGRTIQSLMQRAHTLTMFADLVTDSGWNSGVHGFCAAHGAWLEVAAGDAWLAAGDAALAFDPLSAQGVFNALYFGLASAQSADRYLAGETTALTEYGVEVSRVRDAYLNHLAAWYDMEKRWASHAFWARRCGGLDRTAWRPVSLQRYDATIAELHRPS